MRIGIIAALPGELKPLVRGWERMRTGVKDISLWTTQRGIDELIAVCGGMGADAAMRSFSAAEFLGPLDMVLSAGWAGALDEAMKPGVCYVPSEIIDVQTGERFLLAESERRLRLTTTVQVADAHEKQRLRDSYGATLVDMEAATIARLAQMREIPVCCFKAVSDAPDANLPELQPFIDARGQLNLASLLAHVAVRPQFWGPLLEMGKNSSIAARAVADSVEKFLISKDIEQTIQTGAL
jgi:adenosylhomocysteine nucleosidase